METGFEKTTTSTAEREEIFSKAVRAGKRTYFFDVKSTKGNDYYLTITESKKRFGEEGKFFYEKHKLFLYKEDFEKFVDGLNEAVTYIKANSPAITETATSTAAPTAPNGHATNVNGSFSDVSFEDLGNK
jgi:hypothetical protein